MSVIVLPTMALTLLFLICVTSYLTIRDTRREKEAELKAAKEAGTLGQAGLETSRYRSK